MVVMMEASDGGYEPVGLEALPNEVLLHILAPLETSHLLSLACLSHRFASLTHRIYQQRLTLAADLTPRTLLLECYHPSLRLTEEPLLCAPLGTPGLTTASGLSPPTGDAIPHLPPVNRLRHYNTLYSRFRPYRRGTNPFRGTRSVRHPAGDVPGSRTHPGTAVDAAAAGIDGLQIDSDVPPLVKQQINLDASEIFAQLTAVTSLVQVAPRSGLFYSAVNVSEGVVRLFREWLIERDSIGDGKGKRRVDGGPLGMDEEGVLWVNDGMNVGVRFGVRERKWRRADANPVLIRADEDVAISYEIEIREVLVRTRHLVMVTEQSLKDQQNIGKKAIIIGGWG